MCVCTLTEVLPLCRRGFESTHMHGKLVLATPTAGHTMLFDRRWCISAFISQVHQGVLCVAACVVTTVVCKFLRW